MSMDKTHCFNEDRTSEEYQSFAANFIKYAFANAAKDNFSYVYCPCKKCRNTAIHKDAIGLKDDLFTYDFDPTYKFWFWHGKNVDEHIRNEVQAERDDRMDELVEEIVKNYSGNPKRLSDLHRHNETFLYDGCPEGMTVLKVTLQLMNLKIKNSYSDVGFSSLLTVLKES